ncbi:MAG: tRNA uridine-5-carboxymethylaminomethyl(34) synthesis GTPase MnmE [Gammaproteobacteria bacterium]|nr:tRNA uridine-5-carboxymethylaminomethyl(34) synthesis GTPase MnmE [Gammaproteobacteria bacterium]
MSDRPEYIHDTIVAPATPAGKGGVGVVRISGPNAATIAMQMLGSVPAERRATTATFRDKDSLPIDSGLALYFPAPASFTGESVLELQAHGGPVIMTSLVDAAISIGARRAEPGEFSKRAFLNGKLDLAQAEAVADMINSGTVQAARAAHRSLQGEFSRRVEALAELLINLRLHVEAALDFPEDELDFLADDKLRRKLNECEAEITSLLQVAKSGRILRDGLRIVIVGKPNAGKSSLLNLLSGQDAAIVTEVAGTTRDIIREQISIAGMTVELVDTAGLRNDPDRIEAEGIRRAKEALLSADAVLWVQDVTDSANDTTNAEIPAGVPTITVRNKTDLCDPSSLGPVDNVHTINFSATTGEGMQSLQRAIAAMAGFEDFGEGALTARQRHVNAIEEAAQHFAAGRHALDTDRAGELLAEELRLSQTALGTITGAVTSDDLLGRIFSEFCIGK